MVSGKHKKTPSYKKLQLVRSITNSPAILDFNSSSILRAHLDISQCSRSPVKLDNPPKYVQGLMELNVEKINQDNVASRNSGSSAGPNSIFPVVKVEAEERGFVIKVLIERSCSGLLVFILEAFEELGLDVLHARVSCSHNFHLEAVVIITDNKQSSDKDARRVEQEMFQAIQSWSEVTPLE